MARTRHSLPPIVTGIRCIPVFLPDDDAYIQLLLFAIRRMCQQGYYERDDNHTAKDVAQLLMDVTYMPLLNDTSCCDLVNSCLPESDNFNALVQFAYYNQSETSINPNTITSSVLSDSVVDVPITNLPVPVLPNSECDYDLLWGQILNLVTNIEATALDYAELVLDNTTTLQTAAKILSNVPIVGSFASSTLELMALKAEDLYNSFIAYQTQAVLRETACYFFCLCKDECRYPTFKELIVYYGSLAGVNWGELLELTVEGVVQLIFELPLLQNRVAYYLMQFFTLFVLMLGKLFMGQRRSDMQIWLLTGDADSDWQILCDCGTPPIVGAWIEDFKTQPYTGWSIANGNFVDGVGVQSVIYSAQISRVTVDLEFATSYDIQRMSVSYNKSGNSATTADDIRIFTSPDGITWALKQEFDVGSPSGNRNYCPVSILGGSSKFWRVELRANNSNTITLQSIKIWEENTIGIPLPAIDNAVAGC